MTDHETRQRPQAWLASAVILVTALSKTRPGVGNPLLDPLGGQEWVS